MIADLRQRGSADEAMRRSFNLIASLVGLLILSPLFVVVAIAVIADSSGPVFFRQKRVGRDGKPFNIIKFRSMRTDAPELGGQLTVGADPRVTRVGRYLRAWKVDELPQLINVVRGEMDLVGPRPEVPGYVDLYTPEQRRVLRVRPGITDPASVEFRNESELMGEQPSPESFYVAEIMPRKLALNLAYLKDRSLWTDIRVILGTLAALVNRQERGRDTA